MTWVDHYLDDFITLGPPGTPVCQSNLERMLWLCARLGVPIVPVKCDGPTSVLVYLGFELDTDQMVVRLPREKLLRTLALVREWVGKKRMQKKGVGISPRPPTACSHSDPPRPHIRTSLDRAGRSFPA